MGFTDKFRTQHNEILAVAKEMTEAMKADADAAVLRKLLSHLAGKLNFHLALEDKALYPRLMDRRDTQTRALAAQFISEMGGLGSVFGAYNTKWQVSAIKVDPAGFSAETQQVFTALAQRIARENRELYPLADREN